MRFFFINHSVLKVFFISNCRYIVLVMEQPSPINVELVTDYKTETSCQTQDLESFDLTNFQENLNLSEPVAANYFIQR